MKSKAKRTFGSMGVYSRGVRSGIAIAAKASMEILAQSIDPSLASAGSQVYVHKGNRSLYPYTTNCASRRKKTCRDATFRIADRIVKAPSDRHVTYP